MRPDIWSQITLAGPKILVWPFDYFLALFQDRFGPLQKLDLTTLGPVWETIFFHILTDWLQIFTKFLIIEGFRLENIVKSPRVSDVEVSSSQYLRWVLLAAVVEVVICRYLGGARVCVLFRLLLIALTLIEDGKFISVNGYTWKLSWSVTIFHHKLVLLLSYNCDWGTLLFHKMQSMDSWRCDCW